MRKNVFKNQNGESKLVWLISIVCFAAELTHIYVCYAAERWVFLIAGVVVFPVGIIHGFGIWLGIW